MASFVILVSCHFVSPYNVGGPANIVLYRGRHFWKIARVNAALNFCKFGLNRKKSLSISISKTGALLGLGALLDRQTDSFNIRLFSSVVTVGVRPVGLRFKIIPSSRNVLALRAMQFWNSV